MQEDDGVRALHPRNTAAPLGGYSHGVATTGDLVFISGQTPEAADGSVGSTPEAQLRQVWANVVAVLSAAELDVRHLVHVRTFLASRAHREINTRVRREVLGTHAPSLTVVICDLYEDHWVAEIEAVAEIAR